MFTIGSLFAGIGGIDLAFESAGFVTAWQVENNDYCQQVLAKNFPHATRYGDIYDCQNLPYVDVITAGFPCQPWSISGKKEGVEDDRDLRSEMMRIIDETRPATFLLENVPNFARIDNGRAFAELLQWVADIGYHAKWATLRASDVGAPHRRERLFIVGYTGSIRLEGWQPESWQGLTTGTACGPARANGLRKPAIYRSHDGIPYRLDRHQFPSRPTEPQHEWEPSRTTTDSTNRKDRLMALGNAVVPQVVYPVALAIRKYLEQTQ